MTNKLCKSKNNKLFLHSDNEQFSRAVMGDFLIKKLNNIKKNWNGTLVSGE